MKDMVQMFLKSQTYIDPPKKSMKVPDHNIWVLKLSLTGAAET